MKEAIRLTNKTAIALRRSAQRVRRAHYAAVAIVSIALAALAVYMGLKWLPAVAIVLILAALIDAAILIAGRSRYLQMIGLAICTEAAAQDLKMNSDKSMQRVRAIYDLMTLNGQDADQKNAAINWQAALRKVQADEPFFEEKKNDAQQDEDDDLIGMRVWRDEEDEDMAAAPAEKTAASASPHRRRRRSNLQLIRS